VKSVGEHLAQELSTVDSAVVREVRGSGVWRALALDGDHATAVESAARERGLLVNAVKPDVIRLAPPLVVSEADVDDAMPRLVAALGDAHA
jgi:acetylornithine aminotransferase